MAFTYRESGSNPARDRARMLIGDTDKNASLELRLEDEEIDDLFLILTGSATPASLAGVYRGAIAAGDALVAKFARKAEGSTGPDRLNPTNRVQELRTTLDRLRRQLAAMSSPFAGGISVADKAARAADTDRPAPAFKVGMLDHSTSGSDGG